MVTSAPCRASEKPHHSANGGSTCNRPSSPTYTAINNNTPVNTEVLWVCGLWWGVVVYIRTLMTDQPPNQDPRAAKPGPEEPTRRDSEAMLRGKPPQDPLIGTKVDQYSIKRVIGEGGMGVVYEALQQSPRRTVALKMMKRGVTSKSAMRRFEYEAQTLGRLRHDGIAQIYQAGTWDDGTGGRPWFAMEYIQGAKTLTQYCKDKKLGTRERLDTLQRRCATAVQHGHARRASFTGTSSPPNILVTSSGVPKVIDFGVARSTDSDHGRDHAADRRGCLDRHAAVHEPRAV